MAVRAASRTFEKSATRSGLGIRGQIRVTGRCLLKRSKSARRREWSATEVTRSNTSERRRSAGSAGSAVRSTAMI